MEESDNSLNTFLTVSPLEWTVTEDKKLKLTLVLDDFKQVIRVVNKIADLAESEDHHPDLYIFDFNKLTITLYTHTEGHITEKDIGLAELIDKAIEEEMRGNS